MSYLTAETLKASVFQGQGRATSRPRPIPQVFKDQGKGDRILSSSGH